MFLIANVIYGRPINTDKLGTFTEEEQDVLSDLVEDGFIDEEYSGAMHDTRFVGVVLGQWDECRNYLSHRDHINLPCTLDQKKEAEDKISYVLDKLPALDNVLDELGFYSVFYTS